jgi:hypothetical protein
MYQLSRSKRDVQRFFSETSRETEISEKYKLPELDFKSIQEEKSEPVIKDSFVVEEEEEPATEPVSESVSEDFVDEPEPESEPVSEPEAKPEPEPVVEEPASEPVVEEPASEPVVEEPASEPEPEQEPEPVVEATEAVPLVEEPEPAKEEEEQDDFQPIEEPPKQEPKPPEEPMDDIPITTYDYDGNSYFVDNRSFLQRTFDFPDGSYPINLCIYTCVRNGCCPYLLYLTVYDKSKNALIFPTAETIEIGPEDSEDTIREKTMESFQTALFNLFPPNEEQEEQDDQEEDVYNPHLFQGLFLDENMVFMVYDATRVSVPLATDKEYFWATPYEITALYQYRNINIDPSVTDFFQIVSTSSGFIDKSFHHLKRLNDGSYVPSPYVLFPCSPASPGIFSIFGTSKGYENPVQLPEEQVNLLIPTVVHPSIGNVPLFSSKPLDPSVPHIQRYAVFVDVEGMEPFFVDEETPEFIDHLYDLQQTRQYSSLNFIENNKEYWCVKSPLYFTEIYDHQLQTIPINTFQEIDALNVPTAAPFPKDIDTLSNEGSDAASDEGDELSDEGSDMDGSNEGSMRGSDEESDEEDLDDFHRGYQEGLLAGIKQKALATVS